MPVNVVVFFVYAHVSPTVLAYHSHTFKILLDQQLDFHFMFLLKCQQEMYLTPNLRINLIIQKDPGGLALIHYLGALSAKEPTYSCSCNVITRAKTHALCMQSLQLLKVTRGIIKSEHYPITAEMTKEKEVAEQSKQKVSKNTLICSP